MAIARGASANGTPSTAFAPAPIAFGDANGPLPGQIISMDTGEMTPEIMLPAKGPATVSVRTRVGFQSVGIMSCHVSLEVERSRKSSSTFRTLMLLARIRLLLIKSRVQWHQ